MKRFAGEEDETIVSIPLIVETTIIVVEPRLAIVTIDVEQVRVVITVGISYTLPSMTPKLESDPRWKQDTDLTFEYYSASRKHSN